MLYYWLGSSCVEHIYMVTTDGLPTTDGQLHVTQQPDVILDTSSQQWSIVLTCGNFTSVDQPPFPVEWVVGIVYTDSTMV